MSGRRRDREELGRRRLVRLLARHGVAKSRTLEQKISDAGPGDQRVDPHVLTVARKKLVTKGEIVRLEQGGIVWFHLSSTPPEAVAARLAAQLPVAKGTLRKGFLKRVGQTLEIALYRALSEQEILEPFGAFLDLDDHDDSTLYSKEEPPSVMGAKRLPGGKRLDFLVRHPEAGWAAIEAKNIRAWLYPHEDKIRDLLAKAVALDSVPVLVARRIPFVTFKVLWTCGVVMHQTYNQLYPESDRALADQARDKHLLGFHDIRVGNQPDNRLVKFVGTNLPKVLPEARERFKEYKDLLADFGRGAMAYPEFAARVRRRSRGTNEDNDWDDDFYP